MTTPPPGPPDDTPPHGDGPDSFEPQGIPPGYHGPPPSSYPVYPYPLDYPAGPPPQQPRQRRISTVTVLLGPLIFVVLNVIVGFSTVMMTGWADSAGISSDVVLGLGAALLTLLAFGGGAMMLRSTSADTRGLGLGLMVGWALTSLVTAGICTGVNPTMYL